MAFSQNNFVFIIKKKKYYIISNKEKQKKRKLPFVNRKVSGVETLKMLNNKQY